MAQAPARAASAVRLFDAHCHLQDPRVAAAAPSLIRAATASGVAGFAVNGTSEKDWHLVKQMAEEHPAVVPCFGLHPWWVPERSPDWMDSLRRFFAETPEAAVGEIGLDKGAHGKSIDFGEQVEVFQRQLELAKELKKPVSVHCVRAFGDLLEILKQTGPFPAGMKSTKAKQMLKSIPFDRILLETDAPEALPKLDDVSLLTVPVGSSDADIEKHNKDSNSQAATTSNESLNHPANIHVVLMYVASLLEMPQRELSELSYKNATKLFSYPGSKVNPEAETV